MQSHSNPLVQVLLPNVQVYHQLDNRLRRQIFDECRTEPLAVVGYFGLDGRFICIKIHLKVSFDLKTLSTPVLHGLLNI